MNIHEENQIRKHQAIRRRLAVLACLIGLWLTLTQPRGVSSAQLPDPRTLARASRYEALFLQAAARHGVNLRLLRVIAYLESRFRPEAISPQGARGLMQLMPATAARFGVRNPHDPAAAIDAAARYLRVLAERFGNRPELTLAAYNAGEAAVEAYRYGRTIRAGARLINPHRRVTDGIPPYRETQRYVRDGLELLRKFEIAELSLNDAQAGRRDLTERATSLPRRTRKSISYGSADYSSVTSPGSILRRSITFDETGAWSR